MNISPYPSYPPPSYLQSIISTQSLKDLLSIKNIEALIPDTRKALGGVLCPPLPTPRWDASYLELLSPELQKALIGKKEESLQDKKV